MLVYSEKVVAVVVLFGCKFIGFGFVSIAVINNLYLRACVRLIWQTRGSELLTGGSHSRHIYFLGLWSTKQ